MIDENDITTDVSEIIINKQHYSCPEKTMQQSLLKFYPANPRIYSLLVIDGQDPDQKEIEEQLSNMEHVRSLRVSIEANGGLLEPLIVRDGDYVVLEGNSRLAAYRLLAKKDPIKWSNIKCRLLPSNITDDAIFTLLGQFHIIGRKDWSPFEQAGYLWRRVYNNGIQPEVLAKEMGLSVPQTKKTVEIYEFMKNHNDIDPQRWSYYEEFLKSRSITKARSEIPGLDNIIVDQIKTGEISQAIDIRHKLEPVTKIPSLKKRKKILQSLVKGEKTLDDCFEEAELSGINTDILKNLKTIRSKINGLIETKHIPDLSTDEIKKCKYEITKIIQGMNDLNKKFDK